MSLDAGRGARTITVPPGSADQLHATLRTVWTNLPVLLAGSVPAAAAWVALRALPASLGWLSLVGVGLLVLPLLAGLAHGCVRLLSDEDLGLTDVGPLLVRSLRGAAAVTLVPTGAAVLTLLALQVWHRDHQGWALASVGAGLAVTIVTALVSVVAVPYRLRTAAPPKETWLVSAYMASRNPAPVLGVVSALALGVWAAAHLSFALVLLLPAPLALVWASAFLTATRRSQALLAARTSSLPL